MRALIFCIVSALLGVDAVVHLGLMVWLRKVGLALLYAFEALFAVLSLCLIWVSPKSLDQRFLELLILTATAAFSLIAGYFSRKQSMQPLLKLAKLLIEGPPKYPPR